ETVRTGEEAGRTCLRGFAGRGTGARRVVEVAAENQLLSQGDGRTRGACTAAETVDARQLSRRRHLSLRAAGQGAGSLRVGDARPGYHVRGDAYFVREPGCAVVQR